MTTTTINIYKKSKDEMEKKAKREAQESERLLKEFEVDFSNPHDESSGSILDDHDSKELNPKEKFTFTTGKLPLKSNKPNTITNLKAVFDNDDDDTQKEIEEMNRLIKEDKKKRPKNIDLFLEELKQEQSEKNANASSTPPVSQSTNLFIGNLPLNTCEEDICYEFGTFGPLANVKILYPKAGEEKLHLNGFAAFMNRQDAETALKAMDRKEWKGKILVVDWTKPKLIADASNPTTSTEESFESIYIKIPKKEHVLNAIHEMIHQTLPNKENTKPIMDKNNPEPSYSFLSNPESSEYHYYHWKLKSLAEGHSFEDWSLEPIYLKDQGWIYFPPPKPFSDTIEDTDQQPYEEESDSESEEEYAIIQTDQYSSTSRPTSTRLSQDNRLKLEKYLKTLTNIRENIADVMVFCLHRSEHADEIVEILVESLMIHTTSPSMKLSRLHLLSDLLYNSNVNIHNAWKFRLEIENSLVQLFHHLRDWMMSNIESKLKLEQFKRSLLLLLKVWEGWIIFPETLIIELKTILSENKARKPKMSTDEIDEPSFPLQETTLHTGDGGVDMNEDMDGEPLIDANLDGEPLNDRNSELDGKESPCIDPDLDGEPLACCDTTETSSRVKR